MQSRGNHDETKLSVHGECVPNSGEHCPIKSGAMIQVWLQRGLGKRKVVSEALESLVVEAMDKRAKK